MDFTDVIRQRRSIRKFRPDPVPSDALQRILDAVRLAPSWANMQGVKIVVVTTPEQIQKVTTAVGQRWLKNPPALIVVGIEPNDSGTNSNGLQNYPVDAAIVLYQILLAATNEGLATCWIGWFNEEEMKAALNTPKEMRIIGLTPLGYGAKTPDAQKRKPLTEIICKEDFTTPWPMK